jgi:hypothetical protein
MDQKLTEVQLQQIIAEVGEISRRQEAEFDREQVQEILRELSLPPELLDEAMIQLSRRQVLAAQKKRNLLVGSIVAGVLVLAIALTAYFTQQQNTVISNVGVQLDRITLKADDDAPVNSISRQNNPQVFYRVTLRDAPVGKQLNLSCNWINPSGEIVKQNQYETQVIKTEIWNTHCRYNIGANAKTGNWKVQMFLGDRLLSDQVFEVQ